MNYMIELIADIEGGSQIEQIATTFGVNWPHLISQIVSFCIVCALLSWFAYRPVLGMLEQRRRLIEESLANAARIKAELAAMEEQRQAILQQANAQAIHLFEEARVAAARVEQEETQKAIDVAQRIITQAREAAIQDHDRMLAELKQEVGQLVVRTTAAVTGKVLTPEDQQRLVEDLANQVVG